jgi:hypothetical protein
VSTRNVVRRFSDHLRPFALAAVLLLVGAAPVLAATSAQQVYETRGTDGTPSPLPRIPSDGQPGGLPAPQPVCAPGQQVGPNGEVCVPVSPGGVAGTLAPVCAPGQQVGPNGEVCVAVSPRGVAGTAAPVCAPGQQVGPDGEVCVPVGEEGRPGVSGAVTPVDDAAPAAAPPPVPSPAVRGGSGGATLPVTGFELLLLAGAVAVAGGLGVALRRGAR